MARPDFRAAAARRLSEERELSPAIVSLLSPETTDGRPACASSRSTASSRTRSSRASHSTRRRSRSWRRRSASTASSSRSSSARSARTATSWSPASAAGARRSSRASTTIPALIEEIDDDTALEIAIIENLQREDLSPLDEAAMYDRMIREHGYSVRKLAQKLGKDKGYLENRLRLADAPAGDPAAGVFAQRHPVARLRADEGRGPQASGAGSPSRSPAASCRLVKLRERIEGRPPRPSRRGRRRTPEAGRRRDSSPVADRDETDATLGPRRRAPPRPSERRQPRRREAAAQPGAIEDLVDVLRTPRSRGPIGDDRPVQPGEVPDDRQAPPRERDRPRPDRRPTR